MTEIKVNEMTEIKVNEMTEIKESEKRKKLIKNYENDVSSLKLF
jgi:hypothetical protein